jgi:hypothetical protein
VYPILLSVAIIQLGRGKEGSNQSIFGISAQEFPHQTPESYIQAAATTF